MALLKKIKAATLVETLIASAIILVVFAVASLSLNNVFQSVVKHNDGPFRNRIKEVTYQAQNGILPIPFYEETPQWDITVEKEGTTLVVTSLYKPLEVLETQKVRSHE